MPRFADVVGHRQTIDHLQHAIETGRVSHAYLIQGPNGIGKRLIADAFAQTLECEKEGTDACCQCTGCHQAQTGNHPDIIHVTHEKPATIGVDEIRAQVVFDAAVRPYSGRYKIYIVDEAEKLTAQAQNSLLKTLEEPPSYVVILLLTVNATMLLETIRSRCVLLDLKPVPDGTVRAYLMQHRGVPDYEAAAIASFAQGSIGKAVELSSSEDFGHVRDMALMIAARAGQMDVSQISAAVKEMGTMKTLVHEFLDILEVWYRDALYYKATASTQGLIFRSQLPQIRKTAQSVSYENLQAVLEAVSLCRQRLDANVYYDLAVELLMLSIRDHTA